MHHNYAPLCKGDLNMDYFERTLLNFLSRSKIKMEIADFDMEGLSKAMHREMKQRLDMIAYIVYDDESKMSPAEKISTLKQYFDQDFYNKE